MLSGTLNLPEDILRKIIRTFFSDLHVVIVEFILKQNYITEYSISKELNLGIDRTRLVTNNLIHEKLINYEERIFKNLKNHENRGKGKKKKGFRLRYLYFDKISFIYNIKKKIKVLISKSLKEKLNTKNSFLVCPRKICGQVYKIKDIQNLSINRQNGEFLCTNTLTSNILCGSKLVGDGSKLEKETNDVKIIKIFIDSIKNTKK